MSDQFILPLHSVKRADRASVGGKAAHLGELIGAGLPVPTGFCLTADAYAATMAQPALADAIATALAALEPTDARSQERTAAAIWAAWDAATLPDDLVTALEEAYHALGAPDADVTVAVRSSATIEDQAGASFAGQGETFLNVRGTAELERAVRHCWASFWSAQALAYRSRSGQEAGATPGVLVQRMVAPLVAGVLFTADPITGAPDRIVLEAVPGLGETLVQGEATPERYVLDRPGLEVRSWTAAPGQAGALVEPAQAQALALLGLQAEAVFGAPQDVEWAIVAGGLVVLQSRPITTSLPPDDTSLVLPRMFANLVERLPDPPTPFDVATVLRPLYRSVGAAPPGWFETLPFIQENGVVVGFDPSSRFLRQIPLRLLTMLAVSVRYDIDTWFTQEQPRLERTLTELENADLSQLSDLGLINHLRSISDRFESGFRSRWRHVGASLRKLIPLSIIMRIAEGADAGATMSALMAGVPTVTVTINAELERLAHQIRNSPRLAALLHDITATDVLTQLAADDGPAVATFHRDLTAFLKQYGSRETGGASAASPTWQDDPAVVLSMLTGMARSSEQRPESERTAHFEAARAQTLAYLEQRGLGLLQGPFLALLDQARESYRLREDSHFHLMRFVPQLRRAAQELGRRLTAAGALASPDQVFLFDLDELEAAVAGRLDLRALVQARAGSYAQASQRWRKYRAAAPTAATGTLLRGVAVSAGSVIGPARIILHQRDFHRLRPGDILVAPFTSPSWTPLFGVAAGLVAETGGTMSHAAIVAREYGLPAVAGLAGATQLLHDGELLAVDGTRGTVRRIEEAGADASLDPDPEAGPSEGTRRSKMPWLLASGIAVAVALALARRPRRP